MAQTKVVSELNANVWKIEVQVGEQVGEDQELVILESMKTEIPVTAPRAGRIAEILVEEGQTVSERQVLLLIEG